MSLDKSYDTFSLYILANIPQKRNKKLEKGLLGMLSKMKKAADGFLSGKTKTQAMKDAGYAEGTAVTNQNSVFANQEVVAYIERKQRLAATKSNITLDWVVSKLKEIADASIGDLVVVDPDGSVSLDYTKLSPGLRHALSGISVDEITEGRGPNQRKVKRIKVAQLDKLRALEMIVRHTGLSKEKTTVNVEGDLVERLQNARRRGSAPVDESEP